jgi:YegS/Rv2252/BmrU family lipid kinase
VTALAKGEPARAATPAAVLRSAVVVNPSKVADLDAHREQVCAAIAEAGWPEPLWLTTTPEDPGCGMAREAVEDGVDVVFASGGDGTVMACAAVLAGTEVALAVLPSGTGNLLATNLGLPTDVPSGVALAATGGRRRIDVGAVENADAATGEPGCFTVMAGMGFDAQMLDSASDTMKRRIGWPAYVLAALRHLRQHPMRVQITLDDKPALRRHARTVLVGNVGKLQGGIPLLPGAEPDDGWFDVAILTPRTLGHWLRLAVAVVRHQPRVPRMETFRARRIEVRSNRRQARELDGDVIAPARSLVVRVRPAALTLCVPA